MAFLCVLAALVLDQLRPILHPTVFELWFTHYANRLARDLNAGQPVDFKIEVVDRSGNLTVWPQPLQAPLVPTTYICEGETGNADDCSCCWLISSNPETDCKGRPGMVGPGYPNGFCIDLFGN